MTDPTSASERIESLDIVRGFALVGVFLVNFQSLIDWTGLEGTLNGAGVWLLDSFVVGRFYRLFAFLFGVGFVLQMRRLEARGAPFGRIYLRRLAVLFAIGIGHGMLLWPNDILALFAQLGVLLFLLRHASDRVLILVGILCVFAAPANYYVSTNFADFRSGGGLESAATVEAAPADAEGPTADAEVVTPDAETAPADEKASLERLREEGSYGELVAWTSAYFLDWQTDRHTRFLGLREEFLMFLLGLAVGRRRIFERAKESLGLVATVFGGALAAGLLADPVIGWLDQAAAHPVHGHLAVTFRQASIAVQAVALSLCYGMGALWLVERFGLHRALKPLARVGQMALTSYLLLSVAVTALFYDFGLGLYGRVTVLHGVALASAAYVLVAIGSAWWLGRYRFGPAEWIWRSLTYGSQQSLRR